MSLGRFSASCPQVLQDAITPANAAGVTIVVDVTGYLR
jgi:hypothetical protein